MKRFLSMLAVAVLVLPVMVLAACGKKDDGKDKKTLSSIAIVDESVIRQDYKVGQTFSLDGLQIKLTYSDNSTETKNVLHSWLSGTIQSNGVLTTAGSQTFIITYEGKKTTFTLTVGAADSTSTLTSITVTANSLWKTVYAAGQLFNPKGMEVIAHYQDGTSKPTTGFGWDKTFALATSDETITIKYSHFGVQKTANVAINVISVENYIKDMINGLLETAEVSQTAYWDLVLDEGANKFYHALTATNANGGANLSNAELLALLDVVDEVIFGMMEMYGTEDPDEKAVKTGLNPLGIASMFANTEIAPTKISRFVWYLTASCRDILVAAVEDDMVVSSDILDCYDEAINLGREEFEKVFNALIQLAKLMANISDTVNSFYEISGEGREPTLAEFKDMMLAIKVDALSAVTAVSPEAMTALASIGKVFLPLVPVPEENKQNIVDTFSDTIDAFTEMYPVLRTALLAAINEVDSEMISDLYNLVMSKPDIEYPNKDDYYHLGPDWWITYDADVDEYKEIMGAYNAEMADFVRGTAIQFADAIIAADLGNSEYAEAIKAFMKLGKIMSNVYDITTSANTIDNPSLLQVQEVVSDLKTEAMAVLNVLTPEVFSSISGVINDFAPFAVVALMVDASGFMPFDFEYAASDSDAYPTIRTALVAMVEAISDEMVKAIYDQVNAAPAVTSEEQIAAYREELKITQEIVDELFAAALDATYEQNDFATVFKAALGIGRSYARIGFEAARMNARIDDEYGWGYIHYEPTEDEIKDFIWLVKEEMQNILTNLSADVLEMIVGTAEENLSYFEPYLTEPEYDQSYVKRIEVGDYICLDDTYYIEVDANDHWNKEISGKYYIESGNYDYGFGEIKEFFLEDSWWVIAEYGNDYLVLVEYSEYSRYESMMLVYGISNTINTIITIFNENIDAYSTLRTALLAGLDAVTREMTDEAYDNATGEKVFSESQKIRFEQAEYLVKEYIAIETLYMGYSDFRQDGKFYVYVYEGCGCSESCAHYGEVGYNNEWYYVELNGTYITLTSQSDSSEVRIEQDQFITVDRYAVVINYSWSNFEENGKHYQYLAQYDDTWQYYDDEWYVLIEEGNDYLVFVSEDNYMGNPLQVVTSEMLNTVVGAMLDAIKDDNSDFAITLKAFLLLVGKAHSYESLYLRTFGSAEAPALEDFIDIIRDAKAETLAILEILDETTARAMADLVIKFMPYFLTEEDVEEFTAGVDKLVGYYQHVNVMLTAMLEEIDTDAVEDNMVEIVFDFLNGFSGEEEFKIETANDFIIAIAKVLDAGLTANGGADEEMALEIVEWVFGLIGEDIPADVFEGRGLEAFIADLYADAASLAAMNFGDTVTNESNLIVQLLKSTFSPKTIEGEIVDPAA